MTYKVVPYLDGHVIVSRTGYTGEDGFEIYIQILSLNFGMML